MLLQDSNNCLYPLAKDSVGGIQNPTWTNFSSVQCIATGRKHGSVPRRPGAKSKQLALTVLVMEDNTVLQTILAGNWENLRKILEKAQENKGLFSFLSSSRYFLVSDYRTIQLLE